MAHLKRSLEALGKAGTAFENVLLLVLLLGMIGLSVAQIVLRNFFDLGFYWSDELLRTLVLWIALAGAVAASRTDKHISINLLDTLLGPKSKRLVKMVVHAFGAVICALLAWFSFEFALTTREYGDLVLGNFPAWILQLVMPIGFGLICYRYTLFGLSDVATLIGGEPLTDGE